MSHVGQAHVASFATPQAGAPPPHRFLFHARRAGAAPGAGHVLVQVTVAGGPAPSAAVAVRSDDAPAAAHVASLMQALLLSL